MMGTYERLAERVYPWITARMSRARFLTAMAVGAHVCEGFASDVGQDNVSPAWLIFEWHVVQAFTRAELQGFPGRRKVGDALRRGRRLSNQTYLKSPKVTGYSGIYGRLARGLRVLNDEFWVTEGGRELLRSWERDQRLDGFIDTRAGDGTRLVAALRRAVRRSMERKEVDQPGGWWVWPELARVLAPDRPGRREREWLAERLSRTDLEPNRDDHLALEMRRELLGLLARHGTVVDATHEPAFIRSAMHKASPELRRRLECIDAYEGLGRTIDDALRHILHLSTKSQGLAVCESDFGRDEPARYLAERTRRQVDRLEAAFTEPEWLQRISHLLRYREVRDAAQLFRLVLKHHEEAQQSKPPEGKRPWFAWQQEGVVVRSMYRDQHSEAPAFDDSYVFDYRTATASTFLRDLGRLAR